VKRERTDPYAAVPAYQVEELEAFRKLEYASVGPWRYVVCGDGAPLVMLPGGFMHADMFFYLARHLRGVRTMIPDSYVKQGVVDLAEASAHVEAMLGREGFDAADFIGVSAGGGLVQYLLATSAQLVSRAILSHTGVLEPSRDKEIRRSLLGVRLLPGGLIRRMMRRRTMQDYPESEWAAFARVRLRGVPRVRQEDLDRVAVRERGLARRLHTGGVAGSGAHPDLAGRRPELPEARGVALLLPKRGCARLRCGKPPHAVPVPGGVRTHHPGVARNRLSSSVDARPLRPDAQRTHDARPRGLLRRRGCPPQSSRDRRKALHARVNTR